jgi:hypothetical protein
MSVQDATTLLDVKLHITGSLGSSPTEQHLFLGDNELTNGEALLAELGVTPDAVLWLVIDPTTGEVRGHSSFSAVNFFKSFIIDPPTGLTVLIRDRKRKGKRKGRTGQWRWGLLGLAFCVLLRQPARQLCQTRPLRIARS